MQLLGPEEQAGDYLSPDGSLRSPFGGMARSSRTGSPERKSTVPPSGKLARSARSACVGLPGAVADTVLASGLGYKAWGLPAGR